MLKIYLIYSYYKYILLTNKSVQVNILRPFHGWEEINPNELQNSVKQVLQNALKGLIVL